jgi:glutathione S-transferase
MTLHFYAGSGSPQVWKVWLALEHKQIPYELHMLSFDSGEMKKPEFLAINPRGQVPAIVHDGFALRESGPITEYLEDRWPERSLLPGDARQKAQARLVTAEIQAYYWPALEAALMNTMFAEGKSDPDKVAKAVDTAKTELEGFEKAMAGDFLVGPLSLADFTLYPLVAFWRRAMGRFEVLRPAAGGAKVSAWVERMQALPYHEKTYPPHWKG